MDANDSGRAAHPVKRAAARPDLGGYGVSKSNAVALSKVNPPV